MDDESKNQETQKELVIKNAIKSAKKKEDAK